MKVRTNMWWHWGGGPRRLKCSLPLKFSQQKTACVSAQNVPHAAPILLQVTCWYGILHNMGFGDASRFFYWSYRLYMCVRKIV